MPELTRCDTTLPLTNRLANRVQTWWETQRRATRQQLMLDQAVQGSLIGRVTAYWVICLASATLARWCWGVWTVANAPSFARVAWDMVPAAIGSFCVLPMVIADVLRLSNRFVGPILRLRNTMKLIELGDQPPPLEVRETDMWKDVAERFNRLQHSTPPDAPKSSTRYTQSQSE